MANIQGHEVDSPEFWKKRLEEAKKFKHLHWSVYLANDTLWNKIFNAHKKVIQEVIPEGSRVLDAGCAYGRMSPLFQNYVGVDFSLDFIEEAEELYPDKDFMVGDLRYLPFEDQEFDWGLCVSIKHMIIGNLNEDEWRKMEKELKRVCKKVLILEYGINEDYTDTEETISQYEIL